MKLWPSNAGLRVQVPHHAIQNVSFNWDDHDKFLPGEYLEHLP